MFNHSFSALERLWLLALRLVNGYRARPRAAARLADRLFMECGAAPVGQAVLDLFEALDRAGANHLYLEQYETPGVTGDERDLLAALRACYLDDVLAAEQALSALIPPGVADPVLVCLRRVAGRATPDPRPSFIEYPLLTPAQMAH